MLGPGAGRLSMLAKWSLRGQVTGGVHIVTGAGALCGVLAVVGESGLAEVGLWDGRSGHARAVGL